jgi:hypothetical protein
MLATPLFSATRCSCGFERLDDEEVSDHLLAVFEPDGSIGTDGRVHQEGALRTCSCGLSVPTGGQLDAHFIAVFTPADRIGRDGKRHEVLDAAT